MTSIPYCEIMSKGDGATSPKYLGKGEEKLMKTIDLHVHSDASDGTCTPTEVVKKAYELGVSVIALTDHDTVAGVEEALQAAKAVASEYASPLEVIPGVELSVLYRETELHILGYFIDHRHPELLRALDGIVEERHQRNLTMISRLAADGIDITLEKLLDGKEESVITRGDFSRYLIRNGYVKDAKEAFGRYLGTDTPYYVTRQYLSPEDAVRLIGAAGGVAVLAHPLLYKFSDSELQELLVEMKNMGAVGLEALYSLHSEGENDILTNLAKRYGLLITGGTDFHGLTKPDIEIGKGKGRMSIPYSLYETLRDCHREIFQ